MLAEGRQGQEVLWGCQLAHASSLYSWLMKSLKPLGCVKLRMSVLDPTLPHRDKKAE